tara:strand:- start:603 stop:1574 length:972 start_codon:yes stop_codon:yes gene_type:complete
MASTSITTAFVKQYGSTLDLLAQTMGGKFTGTCLEESIEGEEKYYDQLGSVFASEVTDRYADSPENDITHARRRVTATPYDVGLMLDKFDKVQMLVNPESEYVQQQVHALNRKKDIEFIKGALGSAQTGKTGGTPTDLPSTQIIAHDYTGGTVAAGSLTIAKLAKARSLFGENGVDLDDPLNKAYIAVTPQVIQDMLGSEKTTSVDFNTIKALVKGEITSFYGFEFIISNLLPTATSTDAATLSWSSSDVPSTTNQQNTDRACIAYVKSGIRQVTNPSIMTEISKRDDKRFNYYAYSCMRTGAVRMEEKKVIQINCQEGLALS